MSWAGISQMVKYRLLAKSGEYLFNYLISSKTITLLVAYIQSYILSNMDFEWNEEKNQTNIRKHGLSFDRAKTIFEGFCLFDEDIRFDYEEKRLVATGLLEEDTVIVIVVVFTEREERIRIISARVASKSERRRYNEALQ